jgi:hypothetical protein
VERSGAKSGLALCSSAGKFCVFFLFLLGLIRWGFVLLPPVRAAMVGRRW